MNNKLFSDQALRAFKEFCRVDAATAHLRPAGATDAVTPQLRRAIAQDRRRRMAFDDLNSFDPDTVQNVFRVICEHFPEDVIGKFMTIMDEVAPGCLGDMPGLEDNAEDEADADNPRSPANPNPNQNYNGRGSEAFSQDMPPPFKGRPTPGGRIVGDGAMRFTDAEADYNSMFPSAARIGLDPIVPMNARSAAVTPIQARATRAGLALDAKLHRSSDVSDYEALFGPSGFRVL